MIIANRCARDLRTGGLLVLGIIGSLSSAAAGEFPKTFRQLRDNFEQYVTRPDRAVVFSVFPDGGLSHLDRNRGLHLAGEISRHQGLRPRRPIRPGYPEADVYFVAEDSGSYRLRMRSFSSAGEAVEAAFDELNGRMPEVARLSTSPIVGPVYPEPPRHFLGIEWNGKPIGQFSFAKRFGGWEGHALYAVSFLTGNLLITVEGYPQQDVETPLQPDPREIALKLDRYYTADPLEDLPAAERERRKTLEISVDSQESIVSGREYGVDFPLRSAGQRPVEIRIRVTCGQLWELPRQSAEPRRPTQWVPLDERDYFVRFSEARPQTLRCYHINEEGQCTAWGSLELDISKPQ